LGTIWAMKDSLLDIILASEQRKSVLLLLKDGPKERETLLNSFKISRPTLLLQMRILEDNQLINQLDSVYKLTIIGRLIVDAIGPLLETVNYELESNHVSSLIPPHFFDLMNRVVKCEMINPLITEMFEEFKIFCEASKSSKSLFIITSYSHPSFDAVFSELINNNVNVHVIISRDVISESKNQFQEIIKNDLFHLFVYSKEMRFMSFAVNDYYLRMSPLTSSGDYDNKYILCSDLDSLEWGKQIFEYYLKDSTSVK
jgi:predicted transcriptional regulator